MSKFQDHEFKQQILKSISDGFRNYNRSYPETRANKTAIGSISKRILGRIEGCIWDKIKSVDADKLQNERIRMLEKDLCFARTKIKKQAKSIQYWMKRYETLTSELS